MPRRPPTATAEPWRIELLAYLRNNRDTLVEFIKNHCPNLSARENDQATYLSWIDASGMKTSNPALHFENRAGLVSL